MLQKYVISITIFYFSEKLQIFESFVRSSDLKVFNPELHTGHFRQVMMRTAKDQLMVVVGIHPQDLSDEKLAHFKAELVKFFQEGEGEEAKVTSLYYQAIIKKYGSSVSFLLRN